jgi:hypothetical protein
LEYRVIRVEIVLKQFEDFTLVRSGFQEHVWVRSGHGEGKENLRWGIGVSTRGEERDNGEMCMRKKKVTAEMRMT